MNTKLGFVLAMALSSGAQAFCGFYVAKADAGLYNKASQVVLVHKDNKTAITMFNDFKGEMTEFALVVPVPEVLTREQINVGDKALVEHLDAYSAPRLVEYFDPDPCELREYKLDSMANKRSMAPSAAPMGRAKDKDLGVKIEAQYTVGEYDILILSAKESDGLETWLVQSGYKMPPGASKALQPYIKQKMKFFVAKVNLKEQAKSGFSYLRPLQFAFESPKFMLPIRLGMANADGPQDLLVYAISEKGRVETTNYRTVKLPSDMDVPIFIKDKFADFYKATFDHSHQKENQKVVFTEYAWNMAWCDPCAADPLTSDELRKLGVFWSGAPWYPGQPTTAYITRLHVRYDAAHFPEDLFFQETSDSQNFQGRFVLHHPFTGNTRCPASDSYFQSLRQRHENEANNLATLTGWDMADIRRQMGPDATNQPDGKWYQNIFK